MRTQLDSGQGLQELSGGDAPGVLVWEPTRREQRAVGKKRGEKHAQEEKKLCPNIVINFCVRTPRWAVGANSVCEKAGAELGARGVST